MESAPTADDNLGAILTRSSRVVAAPYLNPFRSNSGHLAISLEGGGCGTWTHIYKNFGHNNLSKVRRIPEGGDVFLFIILRT